MNPLSKISWSFATIIVTVFVLLQSCNQSVTDSTPVVTQYSASAEQGDAWDVENGYLATATTGFKEIGTGETRSLSFNTSLEAVDTTQNITLPGEFVFTLSDCGVNKKVTVSLGESAPLENVEDPSACKVISVTADGWTVDKGDADGIWYIKQ